MGFRPSRVLFYGLSIPAIFYPRDLMLNLKSITKIILKIDCLRFLRCKFVKGNVTEK